MYHVAVLHFDETYFYQKKLLNSAIQIDLRNIKGAKFLCNQLTLRLIEAKIPKIKSLICFIGKGEYHYVSFVFLKRICFPFVLTIIDNHLDMRYSNEDFIRCDSWVYWAAKLRNIKRVYFINLSNTKTVLKASLPVYLSVDKDVLDRRYLNTRWTQGCVSVDELCDFLSYFSRINNIIGVDVCGEPEIDEPEQIEKSEEINFKILHSLRLGSLEKSA